MPGARVANLPLSPVMAFIDTSNTLIGVEIAQNDARYIAAGQPVEITFKFEPGVIRTGKVETVLQSVYPEYAEYRQRVGMFWPRLRGGSGTRHR